MRDPHRVESIDQLRELYRQPSARVQAKKTPVIDDLTRRVIEHSPFFLLSTASATGECDVSPRGGPPGQLAVLQGEPTGRVAFGDLSGNNLLDSLQNIVANPGVGLLVLTPGRDETLRIDGRAHLSTDPELLGRWDHLVRRPKVAVVIDVDNVFIHCAMAFRRSGLWDPATWNADDQAVPDAVDMFVVHTGSHDDRAALRSGLDADYAQALAAEQPE